MKQFHRFMLFVFAGVFGSSVAVAADKLNSPSPEGAEVYIISPADGETVSPTFVVRFGLSGMGVAPAGVDRDNTGHHHLLVDGQMVPLDKPMGTQVIHFGGGQTEAEVSLAPGKHTLQLILGDHNHIPHDPPVVSEKVTVIVEPTVENEGTSETGFW